MKRLLWPLCTAALFVVSPIGCATSNGDSAEDGNPSIQQGAASDSSEADADEPVQFHTLLGNNANQPIPGCNGEWAPVDQTGFGLPGRFCARFRAGDPYGTAPISVAIDQTQIVGVHVQLLYRESQNAKSMYEDLTGQFLGTCTRVTGGDQHELVDCKDFATTIGWQLRHDQPEVFLFYAENAKRLEQM